MPGATAAFLWALGELASTHAHAAKVQQLGANVAYEFLQLSDAPPPAVDRYARIDSGDFDEVFLDTLQAQCEALEASTDDHGVQVTARRCANNARRVRGEYVPLAEDRVP